MHPAKNKSRYRNLKDVTQIGSIKRKASNVFRKVYLLSLLMYKTLAFQLQALHLALNKIMEL